MCIRDRLCNSFDPQALTSLTRLQPTISILISSFDPQALTSLTMLLIRLTVRSQLFRSTGSYEPDPISFCVNSSLLLFRSTGSYEPDRVPSNSSIYLKSFDPQALTSLTETGIRWNKVRNGFDPQALTSLTAVSYTHLAALIWYYFLTKRLFQKLAG